MLLANLRPLFAGLLLFVSPAANADNTDVAVEYDAPDPSIDAAVNACLESEGVSLLREHDAICYNAAIFPEEFMQLATMPETGRIVISSPGGNVATARMMSRILDERDEPILIAGQCMSACAMVIVPGADELQIHRTAHIAVHGIAMMGFQDWLGWLKQGAEPSRADFMMASLGYNLGYTMHKSGRDHMAGHLEGQYVDQAYIDIISERMQDAALAYPCRVKPNQYWGMIDSGHLKRFLGDRITHLEDYDQTWEAPGRTLFRDKVVSISDQTYIFARDYKEAGCDG
ncbi:hypothetical protein [Henriciella sp.]|uniref:hypothetical protein n=1 Tax=Henriciella sp. TaxID=1968823 RepID=UPI002614C996|nr:hypothetical protein [Henriciella sp.]